VEKKKKKGDRTIARIRGEGGSLVPKKKLGKISRDVTVWRGGPVASQGEKKNCGVPPGPAGGRGDCIRRRPPHLQGKGRNIAGGGGKKPSEQFSIRLVGGLCFRFKRRHRGENFHPTKKKALPAPSPGKKEGFPNEKYSKDGYCFLPGKNNLPKGKEPRQKRTGKSLLKGSVGSPMRGRQPLVNPEGGRGS